jgi:hypothetical protein
MAVSLRYARNKRDSPAFTPLFRFGVLAHTRRASFFFVKQTPLDARENRRLGSLRLGVRDLLGVFVRLPTPHVAHVDAGDGGRDELSGRV